MITGLFAGILTFMYIALFVAVIKNRLQHKVSIGEGGKECLSRIVRAHGNFSENVPFLLILMFLVETQNHLSQEYLYGAGSIIVLGRIFHAIGMIDDKYFRFRQIGTISTILTFIGLGAILVTKFVTA